MIFHHRTVSLAVIGSLTLSSESTIGGGPNLLVHASAASTNQHSIVYQRKQQQTFATTTNRARRAKKTKGSPPDDQMTTRAGGGVAKSAKSNKSSNVVAAQLNLGRAGDTEVAGDVIVVVQPIPESNKPTDTPSRSPTAALVTPEPSSGPTPMIENKIFDEEELVLPLGVVDETVISTGDDSDVSGEEPKPIDKENFYMDHVPEDGEEEEESIGGIETKAGGDDDDDGGEGADEGRGGSNDETAKPIVNETNFYEDYVPDEGVGLDSAGGGVDGEDTSKPEKIDLGTIATLTVSPTTSSPTLKPTNSPIVPPPPLPTNAPIVPPPTDEPTAAAILPGSSCFEENGVEVCLTYNADLSCDMQVDGISCTCCHYHPTEMFISTFDCTNIGDEWGQMGLCEPGPMPVAEDKKEKDEILEEDALSILSLDYGDDELAADAISLAWSSVGGDAVITDSIASIGMRQRRGRRRAQAVRRKTAATKKRREAMVE